MYEDLFDILTSNVNVLNFFRDYVFALWQFEDVFSSIDDFEGAVLKTEYKE